MNRKNNIFKGFSWIVLGFLLVGIQMPGFAQQDPVFNQYMNNLLTLQPAYAGMSGYTNVSALSRIQWVGFENAPRTNSFSIQGPFRKYNVGVGLSIVSDRIGNMVRQTGVYADYSYRILLDMDNYISFGLKAGFNSYQTHFSEALVHDPNDPVIQNDINKIMPNFGVGVIFHSDAYFLGISAPKIFPSKISENAQASVLNFYAMGGLVWPVTDKMKFKPTFLTRWSPKSPMLVDLSINFLFFDRVWVGGTYRVSNSYGFIFQAFVNSQIKIGYAYDLTTFTPSQSNAGTHEMLISYDFPYVKKRYCRFTPRYF